MSTCGCGRRFNGGIGFFGPFYCEPCREQRKQTKLLQDQNRILRQDSSDTNKYQEETSTQNHKEDFWIPLAIFICTAAVMLMWELVKWCINQLKIFLQFVTHIGTTFWKILSWPFKFLWNTSTNIYASLTKFIGWQHTVHWWEVVLFLASVWLLLFLIFSKENE